MYLAQEDNLELFVQVGFDALDTGDNGVTGEPDPLRHREIAKRLAPAFSNRNLIAKETAIQKHVSGFIDKMEFQQGRDIEVRQWSDWLALDRRGNTEHLDYVEQLVPSDKPLPEKKELYNIQNVAGQLLLAIWQPLANRFYTIILLLLQHPGTYAALVSEVRTAFASDADITIGNLATNRLKYLQACVYEGLRLHVETTDGLPRISPGAMVDGHYVPKGVICQIGYFAAIRNPRFFPDPFSFHPERWLPHDDPRFDTSFANDDLKASKPFSQGL
ncbi:cytochrome P450 [Xylariaceae sp. FL1272]|nr:cytochrome P450 [Xylariaceae sp. FL1272]